MEGLSAIDDRLLTPLPNSNLPEVSKTIRDDPPVHYLFKVEKFSSLSDKDVEKHESAVFCVDGISWKLFLYPKGDKKRNVNNHISLYLKIMDTEIFPRGWEVHVNFKLFVYDQTRNKYLTIQDADGMIRCYHSLRTEWGFAELLHLDTLTNESNGYLLDDCCIFGAEVFTIRRICKWELANQPINYTYTWKIENFLSLNDAVCYSDAFNACGRDWKLVVYPKGSGVEKGKGVGLYLKFHEPETSLPKNKCCVEFKLRVVDQVHSFHEERTTKNTFGEIKNATWGYGKILPNEYLNEANGFIVKGTLIVEAEFLTMSEPVIS